MGGRGVVGGAAEGAPKGPGVYLFLGVGDEVLYVGTASDLRRRLRQHAAAGPPTSRLHGRYERVRRVVWETAATPEAAQWREADLIHALRPPYNADPGLRSTPPPFIVVTDGAGGAGALRFALDPSPPPGRGRTYGCFPHLGKGVASRLGIAASDGYVALLRLVWAASGVASHMPAAITRSAPATFEAHVAEELRPGLHRLLSGVGARVVPALRAGARAARPAFMQPALDRDEEAAAGFFLAGPRRLRDLRLRHGHRAAVVDAGTYRALLVADVEAAVGPLGPLGPLNPGGSGA